MQYYSHECLLLHGPGLSRVRHVIYNACGFYKSHPVHGANYSFLGAVSCSQLARLISPGAITGNLQPNRCTDFAIAPDPPPFRLGNRFMTAANLWLPKPIP